MRLAFLLCAGIVGVLGETREFILPTFTSLPTTCPDGVIDGQIFTRNKEADNYFVCNRYKDGTSYGEIRSCKIADIYIAVGRKLKHYACTASGLSRKGKFTKLRYPLRGKGPETRRFKSYAEYTRYKGDIAVEKSEAASFVAAAAAAARSPAISTPAAETASIPKINLPLNISLLPSSTVKPDINKSTVDPKNPDCDVLTQDCYFPTKKVEEEISTSSVRPAPSNPNGEVNVQSDCSTLSGDCYYPTGNPGIKYPDDPNTDVNKNTVDPNNPDCDVLTQDCYFPTKKVEEEVSTTTTSVPVDSTTSPTPPPTYIPEDVTHITIPKKNELTCTFNGKEAEVGQSFIVGELYILECKRNFSKSAELKFSGCAHGKRTKRTKRGTSNQKSNSRYECIGEFQADQLRVV